MRLNLTLGCFLIIIQSFAQARTPSTNNTNQEKTKNSILAYFQYDREIIHVQFNKNSYLNNEYLVFKGYVYSKNNNGPSNNTTNVELVIYDAKQNIVQKQLLYTINGTFAGGLKLNDTFKSGLYYFRFFTNWMNNFREDDSFTQRLEILDKNEPYTIKSNDPNWKTAEVTFFPEGGNIIDGINNTVGVKITDCNQKGIELKDIVILDSKLNEVYRFSTNKMGNGQFCFIPDITESYSLKINAPNLTFSQLLPKTLETGVILTYNNKLANNRVAVAVRTNEKGIALYENKKNIILIHQDGNSIQKEIVFNKNETESEFIFDKKYLSNGVNIIRLIDENFNEICERLLFNFPNINPIETLAADLIANDSIKLSGKTDIKQANLSISILPEKNICINEKRSILGTFYLNAYLENPEIDNYFYFDLENNNRIQEMDLLMLNQKQSKYNWENIKSNPPKINYLFEKGVTIKGKAEKDINTNSKFRILLTSLKNKIFEETKVEKNGDFKFENFYAQDSTVFLFQMINDKNSYVKTNITPRVTRNESPYTFTLPSFENICPAEKAEEKSIVFTRLKDKTIQLEEINIKNNYKKEILTHENEMSFNASGYKIGENEFGNVLDFIDSHGYHINKDSINDISIQSNRSILSVNFSSPAVYVDNILIFDTNLLFDTYLVDVDEIYIDKSGASDTSINSNGSIRIFLKPNRIKKEYFKNNYTSLIVTKGFTKNIDFKNTEFETQEGFYNFGTMNWTPEIHTKDDSVFEVKFPRGNQKEIQVLIEGFNNDGQLISEMKTIPISVP
jgi:hypothetical protein